MNRREFLLTAGTVSSVGVAGCVTNSDDGEILGWNVTDREAEVWNDFVDTIDVYSPLENASGDEISQSKSVLGEVSDDYDVLSEELLDNASSSRRTASTLIAVEDFFNALSDWARAGHIGLIEAEDDIYRSQPYILQMHQKRRELILLWNDTPELRDGLVNRDFSSERFRFSVIELTSPESA